MRYLIINTQTNLIENVCEWDGNTDKWQPPVNCIAIQADTWGNPKDTWDGTKPVPKPVPIQEIPKPTVEDRLIALEAAVFPK